MTQKVNPSPQRPASSFKTSGAIAYGGGSQEGYIVPNNETTEIAIQDQDITNTGINQFTETSSSNSFDVSIDGGEAFVFGAWVCTDTTTTITLSQNTSNQKVFLGWNKSAADNVIIGTESTFSVTPGDSDQKILLYSFDTDSNGVTNIVDERKIGKHQDITAMSSNTLKATDELKNPTYATLSDVPTDLPEGTQVYVRDENTIYVEDGT